MNPLGKSRKSHEYTQEEAVVLNDKVYELNHEMYKKEEENKKVMNKLDVALNMLTKEQLIDFIHKTM